MPDYRIYAIKEHRIHGAARVITVDTDQQAIDHATQMLNGLDLEVWEGVRQVCSLKAGSVTT